MFAYTTIRGFYQPIGGETKNVEVIQDLVPLYNVKVKVRLPILPKSVRLVPQNIDLQFKVENGAICYTVPCLDCHQMVEIS